MKKQSGFTLIELLLVLAIIGIISAIAIPALLGQRSRARDKSAQTNAVGMISDIVAAYDRLKEAGTAVQTLANFNANLYVVAQLPSLGNTKNPWGTTNSGYTAAGGAVAGAVATAAAAPASLGQVQVGYDPPAAGVAGLVTMSVYEQNQFRDAGGVLVNVFTKTSNLE